MSNPLTDVLLSFRLDLPVSSSPYLVSNPLPLKVMRSIIWPISELSRSSSFTSETLYELPRLSFIPSKDNSLKRSTISWLELIAKSAICRTLVA